MCDVTLICTALRDDIINMKQEQIYLVEIVLNEKFNLFIKRKIVLVKLNDTLFNENENETTKIKRSCFIMIIIFPILGR